MTKATLHLAQRRTVQIIEKLGFGVIQGLHIRGGQPCYDPAPKIVQSIKLHSEAKRQPDFAPIDFKLKNEFIILFRRLSELPDCTVAIEIRHNLPFRVIVERSCEGWA